NLSKYNSGTGNWDDYTRPLNRTIAARWRAWCATALSFSDQRKSPAKTVAGQHVRVGGGLSFSLRMSNTVLLCLCTSQKIPRIANSHLLHDHFGRKALR